MFACLRMSPRPSLDFLSHQPSHTQGSGRLRPSCSSALRSPVWITEPDPLVITTVYSDKSRYPLSHTDLCSEPLSLYLLQIWPHVTSIVSRLPLIPDSGTHPTLANSPFLSVSLLSPTTEFARAWLIPEPDVRDHSMFPVSVSDRHNPLYQVSILPS